MSAALAVVYAKEVRDAMRDRRTALMLFVASIVTGPLMLVLMGQFVSGIEEKAAARKVWISGKQFAPALVNFLERNDIEIADAPGDYEARVRQATLDAVIVVPETFEERWLAGDQAKIEIMADESRNESGAAVRQAERLLRAFNRESGTLRLMARGVSPDLIEPVRVERVDTSTPRQRGAFILSMITMFAILSPLLGGMTVAIDSTAGERERGSLEPLLANPVPVRRIVAGKWLAAWTFATIVAVLTLAGFVVAASFFAEKRLAALMTFGLPELFRFIAILVPFGAMTAALQMLICTYGRSYREAQTYVSYLATALMFVPFGVLILGVKDAPWQLAVPVLGQQMAYTRVLRGDVLGPLDYLVPAAIALAIAAACVAAVARLLREERIVFGRS
jgi:sodium transport system permease protein